jgi:hypothetical protein
MSKAKLLNNIEAGLLNYYLEIDYSVNSNVIYEPEVFYEGQSAKYEQLAKQILFKAKTNLQKDRVAKIISISQATNRLKSIEEEKQGNVFSIFKKHVEFHGLAANYRNFDKMTEKEMSNILQQLDLTALFDEIDSSLDDE